MSKFESTSFYLARWAEKAKETPEPVKKTQMILDIVQNNDIRLVCKGTDCALYYNQGNGNYENFGSCTRKTFCTETRIMKDAYYLKTGSVASTLNSINHPEQLKNWDTQFHSQ